MCLLLMYVRACACAPVSGLHGCTAHGCSLHAFGRAGNAPSKWRDMGRTSSEDQGSGDVNMRHVCWLWVLCRDGRPWLSLLFPSFCFLEKTPSPSMQGALSLLVDWLMVTELQWCALGLPAPAELMGSITFPATSEDAVIPAPTSPAGTGASVAAAGLPVGVLLCLLCHPSYLVVGEQEARCPTADSSHMLTTGPCSWAEESQIIPQSDSKEGRTGRKIQAKPCSSALPKDNPSCYHHFVLTTQVSELKSPALAVLGVTGDRKLGVGE